ncbi:MAG TPA: hypothetical protein VJV39_11985 [Dongiaceae bacterium]|nr:hypothetical protein [Dongiaceae bacterium]
MLAHLLKAAVRSLAVTVVLGSILIYSTGGLDSPNARGMIGIVVVCFFLFWITFFFMFGPRVPKHDSRRQDRDLDETGLLSFRPRKRHEDDEGGETGEHGGEGGSDD